MAKMDNIARWFSEISGAISAMTLEEAERELKTLVPFRDEFDRVIGVLSPELKKIQALIVRMRQKVVGLQAERELLKAKSASVQELKDIDDRILVAVTRIEALTSDLYYFVKCEMNEFQLPLIIIYGGEVAVVNLEENPGQMVALLDDPAAPTQVEETPKYHEH